jgi:hypothetical protein
MHSFSFPHFHQPANSHLLLYMQHNVSATGLVRRRIGGLRFPSPLSLYGIRVFGQESDAGMVPYADNGFCIGHTLDIVVPLC